MNYMDLYNACDIKANKGLSELEHYVDSIKDLIYTTSEWERHNYSRSRIFCR